MSTRTPRQTPRSKSKEQSWLNSRVLWIVGAILGVIILAPIVMGLLDGGDGTPEALAGVVEEFPDDGQDHVEEGTDVDYETDPPTSGPHYPRWAPPDIYRQVVEDELLVHNLEHGHIVIYYSPEQLSDEAVTKITELTNEYDGDWDAVLAVPRPDMENELTLTAWTYMMELDEYDEELIDEFVDAYRGKGPENPVR
ncbi:MAG: DUF3105 domain-containing protein [Thermomicrobiaceae bacterium]